MKTPDIILEQMLLGEKESGNNAETIARLQELEHNNREILQRYPASVMKQAVTAKLGTCPDKVIPFAKRRPVIMMRYAGLAAAACLTIVLTVIASSQLTRSASVAADPSLLLERVKGDTSRMFIYRKAGDTAVKLEGGERVAENDVLQVSYVVSGSRWGVIFSIDGNGVLTQHYPERGTFSALLDTGAETPLPFSYKLDNAPAFERFIMISAEESFNAQPIFDSIARLSRSAGFSARNLSDVIPANMTVTDIVLYK